MGKKDSTQRGSAPPVEQYRKVIGKHDKKEKAVGAKEMKNRSDAKKSAMNIQDVMMLLGTFVALVSCVYFFFYMTLSLEKDKDKPEENR